jgi:hypothetical protein
MLYSTDIVLQRPYTAIHDSSLFMHLFTINAMPTHMHVPGDRAMSSSLMILVKSEICSA